jgi:acetyl esterase/lipase
MRFCWYAAKPSGPSTDEQTPAAHCAVRKSLSTVRRFAGALVLACLATACSSAKFFIANAPNSFSHQQQHLDLRYGTQPRQALDIIAPGRANHCPVVIFWYGGSWIEGKKSDYRFVGTALAKQGFLVVIADYRLYPQVTFPAFDEDGARAVAWVQQHVADYGGDAKHIVLMGHSAGGHTAAFLAFNRKLLQKFGADPHGISGLVGLSGTYVFVPDSDELRAAFPPPYTIEDWQPIKFVDAQSPPTLLLHGLADREVLPQEAIDLRDALRAAQVPVELELFAHRGHADTVASFAEITRWRTPALADTVSFIRRVTQANPGTSP